MAGVSSNSQGGVSSAGGNSSHSLITAASLASMLGMQLNTLCGSAVPASSSSGPSPATPSSLSAAMVRIVTYLYIIVRPIHSNDYTSAGHLIASHSTDSYLLVDYTHSPP